MDAEKKNWNVYANYKQKENMRTAYFGRKSNIRISHNGGMVEFLKAVIFGFLQSNDFILSSIMSSLGSEVLNYSHVLRDMI